MRVPFYCILVFAAAFAVSISAQSPSDSSVSQQTDLVTAPGSSIDSLQPLKKMVVTSTRSMQLLSDAPGMAYVVDSLEMNAIRANRASDILNYVPGIDIEAGTGVGIPTKKTVSLNGLPSFHTVVLVDGKRLLSSHFHTGADVDVVPAENIERIEVIKDASSALYGSDALGGVINIITRKGGATPALRSSFGIGDQATYRGSMGFSGQASETVSNNTFVSWDQSDGMPIETINWQDNKPVRRAGLLNYKQLTLMDNIDIALGDRGNVGVSFHYASMNDLIASGAPYDAWLFTPGADLKLRLNESLTLSGLLYYSQWHAAMVDLEKHGYASPQLSLSYSGFKRNVVTFGTEGSWRSLQRTGVVEKSQQMAAAFFQDVFSIEKKLEILAALRMDYVVNEPEGGENIGPVFSPKISFLYRPISILALKGGIGRGFRAPHVQDLYESRYHGGGGKSIWRYGNDTLKPEYSIGSNFGAEVAPIEGLSLAINGYNNMLDDMIAVVPAGRDTLRDTTMIPVLQRVNIDDYSNQSLEFDVSYRYRWITVNAGASASWRQSEDLRGEHALLYPGQNIHGKFMFDFPINNIVGLNCFAAAKRCYGRTMPPSGAMLRDYTNLQGGLGINLAGKYEAYFKGDNLLEQPIDVYEDALYTISPVRRFEGGIKVAVY